MSRINKNKDRFSQVRRIMEIFFSDDAVSAGSMEKVRRWLVDSDLAEEKSLALQEKFLEIFEFDPDPVFAPQLWPDLAQRLGFDEELKRPLRPDRHGFVADNAYRRETAARIPAHLAHTAYPGSVRSARTPDQPVSGSLFGRVAVRVAAVMVPVALAFGTAMWLINKNHDSGRTFTTVSVPAAGVRTIDLPDGSSVTADPVAVITFDNAGFKIDRRVKFSGDGLFKIVSSADSRGGTLPFIVETGSLDLNVIGTVFRVSANENTATDAVILYRGSILVNVKGAETQNAGGYKAVKLLVPGERFTVNKVTGKYTTQLIPASEMIDEGYVPPLRFEESSLGDLLATLEANFGIRFIVAKGIDLTGGRYTADFEGLSPDTIFEMLSKVDVHLSFRRDNGGNVVVTTKK